MSATRIVFGLIPTILLTVVAKPLDIVYTSRSPVSIRSVRFDGENLNVDPGQVLCDDNRLAEYVLKGDYLLLAESAIGQETAVGKRQLVCLQMAATAITTETLEIDVRALIPPEELAASDYVDIRDYDFSLAEKKIVFVIRLQYKQPLPSPRIFPFNSAIGVYDMATSRTNIVAPLGFLYERPLFSPDGKTIAVYRAPLEILFEPGGKNDTNGHRLCVVPTAGGEVQVLSPAPNTLYVGLRRGPSWSPDGKRILFEAEYNDPGLVIPQIDLKKPDEWKDLKLDIIPPGIYLYDLDGRTMERITPKSREGSAMAPSWSPDGIRFACIYQGKLAIVDSTTKQITVLTQTQGGETCLWTPDGQTIIYDRTPGTLWAVSAEGTKESLIVKDLRHLTKFFVRK